MSQTGWPDQKLEIQKKIRKSDFLQNSGYYTNMLASIALVNPYSLI